jgi:hypothetical protein
LATCCEEEEKGEEEEDQEEEEEGLFKADAVNEEDPERNRATKRRGSLLFNEDCVVNIQ